MNFLKDVKILNKNNWQLFINCQHSILNVWFHANSHRVSRHAQIYIVCRKWTFDKKILNITLIWNRVKFSSIVDIYCRFFLLIEIENSMIKTLSFRWSSIFIVNFLYWWNKTRDYYIFDQNNLHDFQKNLRFMKNVDYAIYRHIWLNHRST